MIYFISCAPYTKVGRSKDPRRRFSQAIVPPGSALLYFADAPNWVEGNVHYLLRDKYVEREWFSAVLTLEECRALHAEAEGMGDVGHRSLAHTGRAMTEEHRAALRQANLGHKQSKEHREAISRSLRGKPRPGLRGRVPWNAGKATPDDVKRRISASRKGQRPWNATP